MAKFQSLILILVILISVLIANPSSQDVKMTQIQELEASVSAVAVSPEFNQEIEVVPQSLDSAPEQQSKGDYNQIVPEPEPEILDNLSQPSITSIIALVKYLDNNLNIFELNINNRWPTASLTKLMTAVIAIEKGELNKEITINKDTGEIFTAEDLIKTMLIISSNDAAVALAEAISPEFIQLMNQKAAELKMAETRFKDPTGLSFLNQSTVNDLTKLINYIYYNHPQIFEITRQEEIEILELNSGEIRKLTNINQFAGQPDFIGGKTGFIDASGGNLISLFNKQGRLILIIVLGSKDRFTDTEKLFELVANH